MTTTEIPPGIQAVTDWMRDNVCGGNDAIPRAVAQKFTEFSADNPNVGLSSTDVPGSMSACEVFVREGFAVAGRDMDSLVLVWQAADWEGAPCTSIRGNGCTLAVLHDGPCEV